MATFERLIKLYRNSNSITPFEDFTTEILAGILESNQEILDTFVNELLKIEGDDFYLRTQKTYRLNEDTSVRIDLVFENDGSICFVENKVESFEGENQLDNYADVLDQFSGIKKTYLRYCTKYFDPKKLKKHSFIQFKWSDVAALLSDYKDDHQIEDYYEFLKKHNMADNLEITAKEIFLFENLKHTMSTLDDILERIKPAFISNFGSVGKSDNSSQMRNWGRYVFMKTGVFGKGPNNQIGVGFYLNEIPTLSIWIWTPKGNSKRDTFNTTIEKNKSTFSTVSTDHCDFKEGMSKFLASDNPVEDIEKWFVDKFTILGKFVDDTPELEWKVKRATK